MKSIIFLLSLATLASGYSLERRGKICELCIDTLEEVKSATTNEQIEKLVTYVATTVCTFVPRAHHDKCEQFVKKVMTKNFDTIREFTELWGLEEVCQMVWLCPKNEVPMSAMTTSSVCDACTAFVQDLEHLLAMGDMETILENISAVACSLVPVKVLSGLCTEMTTVAIEEFLFELKQVFDKYDGKHICQIAHLCEKGPLCILCEDTLHFSRELLTNPGLETAVNADIKFACSFTGLLHKMCENYADSFTDTLFDQVRKTFDKFDEHNTCVLFDFCADSGKSRTVCDVCKDGFEEVKEVLTSDTLVRLITDEVDLACIAFGPLKQICVRVANKLIDIVFSVFHRLDDVSGVGFCSKLHLCKKPALFGGFV